VFTPDGTLIVSVSGSEDPKECDGHLVCVPPGGGEAKILETRPIHYSNGLALATDGTLFVLESFTPRILVLRDGDLETYVDLPATVPDSLALDEEGGLVISCFQPNRILRVPPDGDQPEVVLDDWTGRRLLTPTNVAFYGPNLKNLAIASLCGWRISAINVPWRGQKLNYPRIHCGKLPPFKP
jgi:sugar lactone lactonase YvrE